MGTSVVGRTPLSWGNNFWEFKINSSRTSISPGSKVQHILVLSAMESLRKVCPKEPFLIYFYLHI